MIIQKDKLTGREEVIFIQFCKALKDYDDCCPDVGFGMSWNSIINKAASQCHLNLIPIEKARIESKLNAR